MKMLENIQILNYNLHIKQCKNDIQPLEESIFENFSKKLNFNEMSKIDDIIKDDNQENT